MQFQKSHLVQELIEDSFVPIFVDDTATVATVLQVLTENNILSVPVRSTTSNLFVGIVDLLDLVTYATVKLSKTTWLASESWRQMEEFADQKVAALMDISGRNRWYEVAYNKPVTVLMDILSKGNTHRAPVVNETRDVIGYVTQSKLLSWALKNKDEVKQAMQEKIKSGHTPITINMREFVIEAFKLIWDKEVSGLAVVDDNGKLVGNISASDLRRAHARPIGEILHEVHSPIKNFLKIATNMHEKVMWGAVRSKDPVCVSANATVEEAIRTALDNKVHRVYVTDANQRPVSVLSLSDLIKQINHSYSS